MTIDTSKESVEAMAAMAALLRALLAERDKLMNSESELKLACDDLDLRLSVAREEAFEEAAKVAENVLATWPHPHGYTCPEEITEATAAAIRALAEKDHVADAGKLIAGEPQP